MQQMRLEVGARAEGGYRHARRAAVAAVTAVSFLVAACSTTKPAPTAPAPSTPAPAAATSPAMSTPVAETDAQKLDRIAKQLAASSIYFDYDHYLVKPEYQQTLEQDAAALKTMPALSLRLEGNADERGSREYNLALGQKRAEAVRQALYVLGIPSTRMEAISFGMEKPRATCHEEKCWAENRRVDLAVARP